MNRRAASTAIVAALLALLASGPSAIAEGVVGAPEVQPRFEGDPNLAKLSSELLAARRLAQEGSSGRQILRAMPRLPMRGGMVAVEIRLRSPGSAPSVELEAAGLVEQKSYPRWSRMTGRIELERLDELAALFEVAAVRPLTPPRRRSGPVTSQGDASIRAAAARTQFGVDGTGVKVGLISDSFNFLSIGGTETASTCAAAPSVSTVVLTGSTPQSQSELPASVEILDNCSGGPNCVALLDEGRALAEIVHDLAPGAELLFHSGFESDMEFEQGITELAACGARVIVDDLIYDREPMFQDGLIAQAAQAAVDGGVAYFSAAGNEAGVGVHEDYLDANAGTDDENEPPDPYPTGNDFHDFGGGDLYGTINMAAGCGLTAVLQWNEPFAPTLGAGASSDLNLHLCSSESSPTTSCNLGSGGFDCQGCCASPSPEGDPVEVLSHENATGSRQSVHLAVDHFCSLSGGPTEDDVRFRIVIFPDGCSLGDSEVKADCSTSTMKYCFEAGIFDDYQIYGHPAAAGALAVAASFYKEIDTNGTNDPPTDQIDVEPFSSLGGNLPFYFDGSGGDLAGAPVTRFKPEITGPDGVNNSFFGSDLLDDGDTHPNFVGTSASAPHVAAVAALLLDAEPTLTGIDVGKLLTCTARDIEATGKDALSGYGLVDAVDAIAALSPTLTVSKSATLTTNVNNANELDAGDVLTYSYEVTNTGTLPLESVDVSDNHMGAGTLGTISCGATTLAPGAMTTCSATYTVVAGDETAGSIANDATATGLACGASVAEGEAMDSLTLPICVLDLVLSAAGPVTGTVLEEACRSIDSGTAYEIQSGDVTFRAGQEIVLRNGFSVATGALFTAELDPDLDLD